MTKLNTLFNYDEKILNADNAIEIITKQEKIAKKYCKDNARDITVKMSQTHTNDITTQSFYYDIRVTVRTLATNNDYRYLNMYYQFIPDDKYFALKYECPESQNQNGYICNTYVQNTGIDFWDTCFAVLFCNPPQEINNWTYVNNYINNLRALAAAESKNIK